MTAIASSKSGGRYAYIFALAVLTACGGGDDDNGGGGGGGGDNTTPGVTPIGDVPPPTTVALPPTGTAFDYQLGGDYDPPDGVGIVSRDRTALASGLYDICYVNGFQAQETELQWWKDNHNDLLLRRQNGDIVMDTEWNEAILDISTGPKIQALREIVGAWIEGCAAGGYDAVEIDNLDTYARSGGRITQNDAASMMEQFALRAHAVNLAVAQKNSTDIVNRKDDMQTDFVVTEECARYDECSAYTDVYGDHVLEIEYRREDFNKACAAPHSHPIILRNLDLRPANASGYIYERC